MPQSRSSSEHASEQFTATIRPPADRGDSYVISARSRAALDARLGALIVRLLAPLRPGSAAREYPAPDSPAGHILGAVRARRVQDAIPLFCELSGAEVVLGHSATGESAATQAPQG